MIYHFDENEIAYKPSVRQSLAPQLRYVLVYATSNRHKTYNAADLSCVLWSFKTRCA